jgi:hypothetical protein
MLIVCINLSCLKRIRRYRGLMITLLLIIAEKLISDNVASLINYLGSGYLVVKLILFEAKVMRGGKL